MNKPSPVLYVFCLKVVWKPLLRGAKSFSTLDFHVKRSFHLATSLIVATVRRESDVSQRSKIDHEQIIIYS